MLWRLLISTILVCAAGISLAQRTPEVPDSVVAGPKAVFYPLPVISYAQETGLQLGLHGLYAFNLSETDTVTRSSSLSATAIYTLKKQFLSQAQADIWTTGNAWHYQMDFSYRYFPFDFYGTGNRTQEIDKETITENKAAFHATVERQIIKNYFAGLHAGMESYRYRPGREGGVLENTFGKNGGKVWFAEALQVFDSRDNLNYTQNGALVKAGLRYIRTFGTAPAYSGWMMQVDARAFKQVAPKFVLAFQAAYRQNFSQNIPFYLMHQLGGDQLMRGYYIGRYRDKGLLASQLELRYRLSREVGLAGFGGGRYVFGEQRFGDARIKPSFGGGLRYFPRGDERLTLRLDYGIGSKEPGEKRQSGFYFSIGQSF